eukprot:TRINITY_DN26049_c0_g2_i1.p1 TRINITY_DN26049_c0_g2~~TRINITY_DN26049_c0_g2_i1.p1  ORF type:complete len:223 (+),score=28.20 TRINITY_DN26049_c0_g2_i1:86-670(+)
MAAPPTITGPTGPLHTPSYSGFSSLGGPAGHHGEKEVGVVAGARHGHLNAIKADEPTDTRSKSQQSNGVSSLEANTGKISTTPTNSDPTPTPVSQPTGSGALPKTSAKPSKAEERQRDRDFCHLYQDWFHQEQYHKILGLDASASTEVVRKGFVGKVLLWHPDRNPKEKKKEANDMIALFSKFKQAYEAKMGKL